MSNDFSASLFSVLEELNREGVTGYEKYLRLKRHIQFKAREKHVPVCGIFELTPLCNLSCKMCYVHLDKEQMGGKELLPVETWISIIDQAIDAGMLYANITGGECLTYSGFKEIYLYLQSRGIEIEVLTNGILLTEEMVSFLDEHPPASIQITVYGSDEDEYERVTGKRVFHKVMDNIARLKEHNLPFHIAVTPNPYMTKGRELLQLLHDLDYPYMINAILKKPRKETGRQLCDAPWDIYMDLYQEDLRLNGGEVPMAIPAEDLPDPGMRHNGDDAPERGVVCGAARSLFCVNWDGMMRPCVAFKDIGEDVLENGFQAAWERIGTQVMQVPQPVECRDCPYEKACGFCILLHLENGNPGHVNPEVCEHIRHLVKEGFVHL